MHRFTTGDPTRRALAGLILLVTFFVCRWIATYQEFNPVGLIGYRYTPLWTIPASIAVAVGGALLALLSYRQTRRR